MTRRGKMRLRALGVLVGTLGTLAGVALAGFNFHWEGNQSCGGGTCNPFDWDTYINWSFYCPPEQEPCNASQYPDDATDNALIQGHSAVGETLTIEVPTLTIDQLKFLPDGDESCLTWRSRPNRRATS